MSDNTPVKETNNIINKSLNNETTLSQSAARYWAFTQFQYLVVFGLYT